MKKRITYILIASFLVNSLLYFYFYPILIQSLKNRFAEGKTVKVKYVSRIIELSKNEFESLTSEIVVVISEIREAKKYLHRWAKPQRIKTPFFLFPFPSISKHQKQTKPFLKKKNNTPAHHHFVSKAIPAAERGW